MTLFHGRGGRVVSLAVALMILSQAQAVNAKPGSPVVADPNGMARTSSTPVAAVPASVEPDIACDAQVAAIEGGICITEELDGWTSGFRFAPGPISTATFDALAMVQVVSALGAPSSCWLEGKYHVRYMYNRETGVAYDGNWTFSSTVTCDDDMLQLATQATLIKDGDEKAWGLHAQCDYPYPDMECRSRRSFQPQPLGFPCGMCNGIWHTNNKYWIQFPAGYYIVKLPKYCIQQSLSSIYCELNSKNAIL